MPPKKGTPRLLWAEQDKQHQHDCELTLQQPISLHRLELDMKNGNGPNG